jgi:hypothetical protein
MVSVTGCLLWSCSPAIRAVIGLVSVRSEMKAALRTSEFNVLEIRRNIQMRFLKFDVYIPLDDIIFLGDNQDLDRTLEQVMKTNCGKDGFSVWLPIKLRFPFAGEKVIEWCSQVN